MPWQSSISWRDLMIRTNEIVSGMANYPLTVKIPRCIVTVDPRVSARLLEKQWRARTALKRNPLAKAMNIKLRIFYRDSARAVAMTE